MSIRQGHKTRHRCSLSKLMSALGHKRTFRSAIAMSALPPKADIGAVRFECPLWATSRHRVGRIFLSPQAPPGRHGSGHSLRATIGDRSGADYYTR